MTVMISFIIFSCSIHMDIDTQNIKHKRDEFSTLSNSAKLTNFEVQLLQFNEKSTPRMENST